MGLFGASSMEAEELPVSPAPRLGVWVQPATFLSLPPDGAEAGTVLGAAGSPVPVPVPVRGSGALS